jgi:hypothetical protein
LSFPQQVVQASHVAYEAGQSHDPTLDHPHFCVCGVKGEADLHKIAAKLDNAGIRYCVFREADRNDECTALMTAPVFGDQRRLFRRYRCLGSNGEYAHFKEEPCGLMENPAQTVSAAGPQSCG